jgi:hypothetical protein
VADPLPQALVLTAIVIGFATTGFVIELALRSRHESGSDHVDGHEPGGMRPGMCQVPPRTTGMGGVPDVEAILDFWAQHAPVLSVLLPVFTAVLLLLLGDHDGMSAAGGWHDDGRQRWRRRLALAQRALGLFMAVAWCSMRQRW